MSLLPTESGSSGGGGSGSGGGGGSEAAGTGSHGRTSGAHPGPLPTLQPPASSSVLLALSSPGISSGGRSGSMGSSALLGSTMQPWEIGWQELRGSFDAVLGEGSYGRVYLCTWHETPVAVKILLSTGEGPPWRR